MTRAARDELATRRGRSRRLCRARRISIMALFARGFFLVAILLTPQASALPTTTPASAAAKPPKAGSPVSSYTTVQDFKTAMLTALGAGATKVQHMLSGAGLMMGDPDGFGVFSSRLVHSEYEAMTTWWCGLKEPQRPANSQRPAPRGGILQFMKKREADDERGGEGEAKKPRSSAG